MGRLLTTRRVLSNVRRNTKSGRWRVAGTEFRLTIKGGIQNQGFRPMSLCALPAILTAVQGGEPLPVLAVSTGLIPAWSVLSACANNSRILFWARAAGDFQL